MITDTTRTGRTPTLTLRLLAGWLLLACLPAFVLADHIDETLLARADALRAGDLPALQLRAARGDAEAQLLLGEAYHRGRVVTRDEAVASTWFERAAGGGSPLAQYWLGRKHDLGDAVAHDQSVAAAWYRRAAEQGHVAAQNRLGELYARGLGVEQDFTEALAWFERAAAQGDADAEANLAAMHYHGRGVDRDYHQAFVLFHRAAVDGNDGALLILGNMALHGLGTERSLVQAYHWYALASVAHGGDERTAGLAESMLDRLGPHMDQAQINQALTIAGRWSLDLGMPVAVSPDTGLLLLEQPRKRQKN